MNRSTEKAYFDMEERYQNGTCTIDDYFRALQCVNVVGEDSASSVLFKSLAEDIATKLGIETDILHTTDLPTSNKFATPIQMPSAAIGLKPYARTYDRTKFICLNTPRHSDEI